MDRDNIIKKIKKNPNHKNLDDVEIDWFVDTAINKCLRLRFPFKLDATEEDIDQPFFHSWIVEASTQMIQNVGVGNIKSYSEIGMSISYKDMEDGISKRLMREITPVAGSLS